MALYDPKEFPAEVAPAINNDAAKLAAARKLIERGWCQKALEDRGNYCLLGALNKSISGSEFGCGADKYPGAFTALVQAIGVRDICDAVRWNNAEGRTQAEVVEAFRRAEAIARAAQ